MDSIFASLTPPRNVAAADWWRRLYQINAQPLTIMDKSWWIDEFPELLNSRITEQPRGQRVLTRLLCARIPELRNPSLDFALPERRLLLLPPEVFQNLLLWAGAAVQVEQLRRIVSRPERQAWITALGAATFEGVIRHMSLRLGANFSERLTGGMLNLATTHMERTISIGIAALSAAWAEDSVLALRARWLCPRPWLEWFEQRQVLSAAEALSLTRKLLPAMAPAWLSWFEVD